MVIKGPGFRPSYFSNVDAVDNYEVVEFVTQKAGFYTVVLSAPRWSPCAAEGNLKRAPLALAWTSETWTPPASPAHSNRD